MARYSKKARRNLMATSADDPFLILLEISHVDLEVPVRVVNDVQNATTVINVNGVPTEIEFVSCPFEITLPDDVDRQVSKAQLSVDNIGRDLTQWLEYSGGGKGAKVRILQAMRDDLVRYDASDFGAYATGYFAGDYTESLNISDWSPWEYDMTLDLSGISIDNLAVSGDLGHHSTLSQSAVAMRYDPGSSPGLW